ncbi:MFS transporter, partial [Bacillus cereus]
MLFDQAHPWSLFIIQLTLGMIQPLYVPASLAILPTLISKQQLTQANAFLDGVLRLMGFLAPPLGGLLISIIGIKWTYLLVGCLFFLSAVSLMKLNEK